MGKRRYLIICMCALFAFPLSAQKKPKIQHDSTYIHSYRGYLVGRMLFNRKYTRMNITNERANYFVRYIPNKTVSIGAGISYKFATLNFSTGVLEPDNSRGHTRNFDFQFHRYGRKITIDVLLQLYKGFYVPNNKYAPAGKEFYVRPDLHINAAGASVQHLFNHRRFSYRAAFQQTEIQKKSAGTFLLGAELYAGSFSGDSTIVPTTLLQDTADPLNRLKFVELGPNGGYAHTFVYRKFFVTGSLTFALNAGINRYFNSRGASTSFGISPNTVFRVSTGYGVKRWSINLLYISTALQLAKSDDLAVVVNAGNYRMNVIYRFTPTKKSEEGVEGDR